MATITEIKTVKDIIGNKIANYGKHKQSVKSTITKLEDKQKKLSSITEQKQKLDNAKRTKIINKLLQKGILKKFFDTAENSYGEILEEIKKVVKEEFEGETIQHDANKFHSVIWLRDNEKPADTYSFYNSKNDDITLYAKAGLNQRSYHLWANGNRDGDYVEVYYDHLNRMQTHDFMPHNDRRFCHRFSDYLDNNNNSEAREYLRKREEIWKNIYNANPNVNPHSIEKIFAFAFVLKIADTSNNIDLKIENAATNFSVKLICKINLTKEELSKVLNKYGTFIVNDGITFEIEFGETTIVKKAETQTTQASGVNAFYKLKNTIENKETQTVIGELLKQHSSLITSDFSDELLSKIFIDILLFKIKSKIDSFTQKTEIQTFQSTIQPCITKLNKEVERLKNAVLDMNSEYIVINRMNAQLIEWHKLMDDRLKNLGDDETESNILDNRDL